MPEGEETAEVLHFNVKNLNDMGTVLQTCADTCISSVTTHMQDDIVNTIKDAWIGPSIVTYFESVDSWVNDVIGVAGTEGADPKSEEGSGSGIVGAVDSLRKALKYAGERWVEAEKSNGGILDSVDLATAITTDVKYASTGIKGGTESVDFKSEVIDALCGNLDEVKSSIATEISGAKDEVMKSMGTVFSGGGQIEAIQTCFDRISTALGKLFDSLTEDKEAVPGSDDKGSQSMKTAFETAKKNYGTVASDVKRIFTVDGYSDEES